MLFIQIRMIAALAHLGGYDLNDDRVKDAVLGLSLWACSQNSYSERPAVEISQKMAVLALKRGGLRRTFIEINKKVGFRLLTKFGEKGAINVGRASPVTGRSCRWWCGRGHGRKPWATEPETFT